MTQAKKKFFTLDPLRRFFRWTRETLDMICDRPAHMQRLAAIGFGLGAGAITLLFIYLLVHYGEKSQELAMMVVPILGHGLYISMALMGLGALVVLGLIKGIGGVNIQTPGGINIGIRTQSGEAAGDDAPFDFPNPDQPSRMGDKMEGA